MSMTLEEIYDSWIADPKNKALSREERIKAWNAFLDGLLREAKEYWAARDVRERQIRADNEPWLRELRKRGINEVLP